MNIPCPAGEERYPSSQESEALLESVRESILNAAYSKLDDAMAKEVQDNRIYVMEAPVDTPDEEVMAVMLTRDGERPFKEELQTKEQLILYFPFDMQGLIWLEHIRDGMHDKFSLDKFGLEPYTEAEDLLETETMVEPGHLEVVPPSEGSQVSATARLSMLREKVERFLLTPQD